MIVVDSSVWIAAFRSASGADAIALRSLLDADEVVLAVPVRTELLMGASTTDRRRLEHALKGLPLLYPTDGTWGTIDRWTAVTARKGHTFAIADLLIGALAEEVGGLVWSHDADFERMESLNLVHRFDV